MDMIYNIASDLDDKRKMMPHILNIHINMLGIALRITLMKYLQSIVFTWRNYLGYKRAISWDS